jgi:hypothetical protein
MVQWGINLNPEHPAGQPSDPAALDGLKWVRVVFKIGAARRTLDQALSHYDALVARYNARGIKVLFVLNQETFWGNAPWDSGDWLRYAVDFAAEAGMIAQFFAGRGVGWEIWNEGDLRGESSVFVTPSDYAKVLRAVAPAVKARDASAPVIVGGLAGGDEAGYLAQVRDALGAPLPVDGIGFHPYAHYPPNFATKPEWGGWFGELAPKLAALTSRFPGVPVWITEIGVSEHIPFPPEQYPMVIRHIEGIQALVSGRFAISIPVVIWFAWSDGMRNAGIVDNNNQPKQPLYDRFFQIAREANLEVVAPPDPALSVPMRVVTRANLRVRTSPRRLQTNLLLDRTVNFGETILVDPASRTAADGYIWWRHALGWSASETENGSEFYLRPVDAQGNLIEPPPAPVTAPVEAPPVDAPVQPAAPQRIKFRVVGISVNVRTEPRTGDETLTDKKLVRGDVIETDPASRTESSGFIWWQHDLGWSASRAIDGSLLFMEQVDSRLDKKARTLEVPWVSQVDANAPGAFDCGQACVLMLLKYYGKAAPELAVKNLTDIIDGRTTAAQLIRLAHDFGLTIDTLDIRPTIASLQTNLSRQLDLGKPALVLVNYRDLGFDNVIANKTDPGLHWLVVVGVDRDTFYVHDPLWLPVDRGQKGGAQVPIRVDALARAYRGVSLG